VFRGIDDPHVRERPFLYDEDDGFCVKRKGRKEIGKRSTGMAGLQGKEPGSPPPATEEKMGMVWKETAWVGCSRVRCLSARGGGAAE